MRVEIHGLAELRKTFLELATAKALDSVSYKGTMGAAKDLQKAIRFYAQQAIDATDHSKTYQFDLPTGALVRGVAIKRMRQGTQRGYTVGMRAGSVRTKKQKRAGDDPFYWWFLEFGTRYHAPRHFFRDAFSTLQTRTSRTIIDQSLAAIMKAAADAVHKHQMHGPQKPRRSISSLK